MLGWATIATASATSRICNGLYSQSTGVVLFQGGAVEVVFMVRGSGHHEKPIRKACVVGDFGEHL